MVAYLLNFWSPWDKNCFKDLQRVFLPKCFSYAFTNQVEIIFCSNQHATDAFHLALNTIPQFHSISVFFLSVKTWANLLFQNDTITFNRTNIYFNTQPTQTQVPWNRTKKHSITPHWLTRPSQISPKPHTKQLTTILPPAVLWVSAGYLNGNQRKSPTPIITSCLPDTQTAVCPTHSNPFSPIRWALPLSLSLSLCFLFSNESRRICFMLIHS